MEKIIRTHSVKVVTFALLAATFIFAGRFAGTETTAQNRLETRCGWFQNPTPSNAWLIDRNGEWIIGIQGGYQAKGDWPDFADDQWVETNVHYGYGCACMNVTVNRKTQRVIEIKKAYARPLSACRKDPALKGKEPN